MELKLPKASWYHRGSADTIYRMWRISLYLAGRALLIMSQK